MAQLVDGKEVNLMKKLTKKNKKNTIQSFSCSCGTCSGCSKWGTNGGAARSTGSHK